MTSARLMSAPDELPQPLDAVPDAMVVVDRQGLVAALNLEAQQCFGWTEPELFGEPMNRFIPDRFYQRIRDYVGPAAAPAFTTRTGAISCFAKRRDGSEFPVEMARRSLGQGEEALSLVTLRDLTRWTRALDARSRAHENAQATLEATRDAVITTDVETRITYLNPVAEHLTGWTSDEAMGQLLDVVFSLISTTDRHPIWNTAIRCLEAGRVVDLEEGVVLLPPVGHRLTFEASHDVLTGLINRREFERRLTRVVSDLASHADELLRRLASLLAQQLRKHDSLARLGGNEFAVLLEDCPVEEAERIAEALRAAIEQFRFEWVGNTFSVSASVGLIPVTSEAGEAFRVTRLARAVDENHFQLYWRPIVAIQPEEGQRAHIEILLRLPDGQGGVQDAADFLPQAERYSLMPSIDRWVVRKTIALLGQWQREYPSDELPVCSINLSASALAGESLVPVIEHELARHGLRANVLCFEVADDPVCGSIVNAVHQIGRSMGVATIAKQVGSSRVLHKLEALGIGLAQGRALRPPVPLTDGDGRMLLESIRRSA